MDQSSEKTLGLVLILIGISMWNLLPPRGFTFSTILSIHMSFVLSGVYFFERPLIRFLCAKIRRKI
ncbi:hypothetical protein BMS3Abin16_00620 [archaeon BMS3Abin16]|nr:hypothetical protein BMS3Abin16_00620 [archaeon BMS3Abin16]GBE56321.1 hypothetical protein BMS3Bbin16_00524 [archaeon BMS3Bbin16]